MSEMYQVIADVEELEWFFKNVLQTPGINESYAAVLAARFKKLSESERLEAGIAKREAEFMITQTFRRKKIHTCDDLTAEDSWSFAEFLKHIYRFNVDKRAYTTTGGNAIPEKCLAVIFYVNPCDELKVADEVAAGLATVKTGICKAVLNGKDLNSCMQSYQAFGNLESNIKRARAHCKGSVYWLDFDLDCPGWFKSTANPYYDTMCGTLDSMYGRGNYLIVDTSGGFHILVRTLAIHANPHDFCKSMEILYMKGIKDGCMPYYDDKGTDKFECIVNDSQIPGIPLPGTYQYGRPVKILNKADFNTLKDMGSLSF